MVRIAKNKFTKNYESEEGGVYRRITASMGWPYLERPGFMVVMAEDAEPDFSLVGSPRHLRILDEVESPDLETLYRAAGRYKKECGVEALHCDCKDTLRGLWAQIPSANETPVKIRHAARWDNLDLRFVAQVIHKRTKLQKTLHFGSKSRLPRYLDEISALQLDELRLNHYPAVTALGVGLAEMELVRFSNGAGFRPRRR